MARGFKRGAAAPRGDGRADIAAIHVLKKQLRLSDDDYRALLAALTGKSSCADMAPAQLAQVRAHMHGLAQRMGLVSDQDARFAKARREATPKERKVWALWLDLGREGHVRDTSARALNAFVMRTVQVSALAFCAPAQLNTVIEALKGWGTRLAGKAEGASHG